MEFAEQAWLWLGEEDLGFGLRWMIVAVLVLGFGGWIGTRYRAMRLDVENLREQVATLKQAPGSSRVETDNPHAAFRKAEERWLHQPGVGREAARLIMIAPTFEDVRAVHGIFKAADRRLDASWAHFAFLYRMEMEGSSDEVMAVAAEVTKETGDHFNIDVEDDDWKELRSLYRAVRNERADDRSAGNPNYRNLSRQPSDLCPSG